MSPTARTLKLLRDQGYLCSVVERWIPGTRIRSDCLGFADILGVHASAGAVLVQATSGANHAARRTKLAKLEAVQTAKHAGLRVLIVSWIKSARTHRWTPRIESL